jgi:RNA polymerase sigma factor (TIGR02999 family)
MTDVTRILSAIDQGDPTAAKQLLPLVYNELRQLAALKLAREQPGQTLQATALVHEAYLRLIGPANRDGFECRGHFFAAAAEAMRRLLVESARRKQRQKRGGEYQRVDVPLEALVSDVPTDEMVALDEALVHLAAEDPLKAKLVELRFFGGLTEDEAAAVLNISDSTAKRYWRYARARLHQHVAGEGWREPSPKHPTKNRTPG